jgi:hypothetical protein
MSGSRNSYIVYTCHNRPVVAIVRAVRERQAPITAETARLTATGARGENNRTAVADQLSKGAKSYTTKTRLSQASLIGGVYTWLRNGSGQPKGPRPKLDMGQVLGDLI